MWSSGGSGQNTEGGQIVKIEVLLAAGNLVFLKARSDHMVMFQINTLYGVRLMQYSILTLKMLVTTIDALQRFETG